MNLRHTDYNNQFLNHVHQNSAVANQATAYGVRIRDAEAAAGASYWRVIGVHHLSPEENRGDHHVYVEVLDEQGRRVKPANLAVHWTWEGRQPDQVAKPAALEKPDNEPLSNVPIARGAVLDVWLAGDGLPSDVVGGLRANHDDEPGPGDNKWNTRGHHSFYVVFQRTTKKNVAENGSVAQPDDSTHVLTNGDSPAGNGATGANGQLKPITDNKVGDNKMSDNKVSDFFPDYIFGLHECAGGGEGLMLEAGRAGWVLELASVGLDGGSDNADFQPLVDRGLSVVVRLHNGYKPNGALPHPQHYDAFANACATFVRRSHGCHIWIIGNEPNHEAERPQGEFIFPQQYADAYTRCRRAIRQIPGHEFDLVLVAGPAPWNAETRYPGNAGGDWVKYFADQIDAIPPGECDGFAIHAYTHEHDPAMITADLFQGADGYKHLRNEFRTYRDFMEAIPARCRHLPVLITEADPTNPNTGWADGQNKGWVCQAYREIADWNRNPSHQPIQGLLLYRWPDPQHHGQQQWSIANRPGVIEDFKAALRAEPAMDFGVRLPARAPVIAPQPAARTIGRIPNIFTNQHLINAFFFAAQTLNVSGDELMQRAGLDVHQLAADEAVRQARYAGLPVDDLPNLNDHERALIALNLIRELRNVRRWRGRVNAPDGLNLRSQGDANANVLTSLTNGAEFDVLNDENSWLCVAVDAETAGFVHCDYVTNLDEQPAPAPQPLPAGDYFHTEPALRNVPLAPPVAEQITLSPSAQPGAQRLAAIWNQYGGLLTALADRLQIDPAVAVAVLNVESGGQAFGAPGKPIIRFENHLFYADWGNTHADIFDSYFRFNREPNQSWKDHQWRGNVQQPFQSIHKEQMLEWQVLDFAANLAAADTAAKCSISMGLPQILGRNHQRIGYGTVQEMFQAFCADERNHVLGLFDFIRADANMVQALRNRDYFSFATGYNGSGQAATYEGLIKNSVAAFHQLSEVSLAIGDGAELPAELDSEIAFIPMPQQPDVFTNVGAPQADVGAAPQPASDEVRQAWIEYVKLGLENNNMLFRRILRAFIIPYYMTVAMYALLFVVGLGLFVVAAVLGLRDGKELYGVVFAGLSIATFVGYFFSRPLRSLEENLQLITWLGIAYNTYWTRLLYMEDRNTVHDDLKDASAQAAAEIQRIIDKSKELAGSRPGSRIGE